ncbi:Mitochondrial import receptor subunit TOM20 -like protein B, partial [Trichinella sp. T9]
EICCCVFISIIKHAIFTVSSIIIYSVGNQSIYMYKSSNMLGGKIILWGVSGLAGALFVAYCIYFDRKRRQDPQYKKKIAEKRKKQTEMTKKKNKIKLPANPFEMQAFVSCHTQLFEECLSRNKYEEAAEHLAYIFACSGESGQMQDMVRYMFPPIVMEQLESKLPAVREELYAAIGPNAFSAAANVFDDLE